MNKEKAAALFAGWNEAMIWSCLQGYMGSLLTDNEKDPKSAVIVIGDFCFFAGIANPELFRTIQGFKLLIPKDETWERLIEQHYNKRVRKLLRYAIKKEPDVFEPERLSKYSNDLAEEFEMCFFNRDIVQMAQQETWSEDLCSQFEQYNTYREKAMGVAILHQGKLVSGASPYAIYSGGIEIEIDTKPDFRKKGLATACGAKLILECLNRNLYPSWDAHDLRSVALAEKLGYHLDTAYTAYELFDG